MEHLTQVCQRGGGHSFECCAFNHERVLMSCLQRLDALEANNETNNDVQGTTSGFRVKGTATLWMAPCHREHGVAHSVHRIRLYMQSCLVITFSEV